MKIGVVTESFPGERRVAIHPDAAPILTKSKLEVVVQSGAGRESGFPDDAYAAKGGRILANRADVFRENVAAGHEPMIRLLPWLRGIGDVEVRVERSL